MYVAYITRSDNAVFGSVENNKGEKRIIGMRVSEQGELE